MELEEDDDEDMGDVVPVMGSSDNQTVAEEFAAEAEGAEIVELE